MSRAHHLHHRSRRTQLSVWAWLCLLASGLSRAAGFSIDLDTGTIGSGYSGSYTENGAHAPVSAAPNAAIVGNSFPTMQRMEFTLTNPVSGDYLVRSGALPGGITYQSADSTNTKRVYAGSASVVDYETVLGLLYYYNSGEDPGSTTRYVTVRVQEDITGNWTPSATASIAVTPVNDLPDLDLDASNAADNHFYTSYVEDGPVVAGTDTDTLITDPDDANINYAYVYVTNPGAGDQLYLSANPYSGTVTPTQINNTYLTLTGVASKAAYQTLLELIRFESTSNPVVGQRTIRYRVRDESNGYSPLDSANGYITVSAVNDAPVIDLDADDSSGATGDHFQTGYVIGGTGTLIPVADSDVTVSDEESTQVVGLIVDMPSPAPGDQLLEAIDLPPGIGLSASSTVTRRAYTGVADFATVESLIRGIRYTNPLASPDPTPRIVRFRVGDLVDGYLYSSYAETTIGFTNAPVIDLDADDSSGVTGSGYARTFIVGGGPVGIADSDALITDSDGDLAELTITIDNGLANDVLAVSGTLPGSITVDAASTSHNLILSGKASAADYTTALGQLTYNNTNGNPALLTRTLTLQATDDDGQSGNPATATIRIAGGLAIDVTENSYLQLADDGMSYAITVTNHAATAADGVTVSATLPPEATFVSFFGGLPAPDWDCNLIGQTAICSYLPPLPGGAVAGFSIELTAPPGTTSLLAQFTVGSNSGDAYARDNSTLSQSLAVNFTTDGFRRQQSLIELGTADGDLAGGALILAGNNLAIGVPGQGTGDEGRVIFWQRSVQGDHWSAVPSWTLQASTPEAGARFGQALAYDDQLLVVGAPYTGLSSSGNRGVVYVFEQQGGNWVQIQKLLPSDSQDFDEFGSAIALDGDTLAIGAPNHDTSRGAVYLFERTAGGFVETQKITRTVPGEDYLRLGEALAVEGKTLVIGAPTTQGIGSASGHVFVYTDFTGTWKETQELGNNIATFYDRFGRSVDIDGDRIAVGAQYNLTGIDSGAVHVYRNSGSSWDYEQRLTAYDAIGFEELGWSVDLQGETIVSGAPGARTTESGAEQAGSVYVFQLSDSGWTSQQKHSYPDPTTPPGIAFGTAVALDNATLATGAPQASGLLAGDPAAQLHGLVHISRIDSATSTKLVPLVDGAAFGNAVAMSNEVILVGAPAEDQTGCTDCGAAYFFRRDGDDWMLEAHVTGSSAGVSDAAGFGTAVDIDGDNAIIGAPLHEQNSIQGGAAYVYSFLGGNWTQQQLLLAGDAETADDRFGNAVAIDGTRIAVGAEQDENTNGLVDGAVYLYEFNGNSWIPGIELHDSISAANDRFGCAVALDLDSLAVGACDSDAGGTQSGAVHTYYHDGNNWVANTPELLETGVQRFGAALDIYRENGSANGVLLIGAPDSNVPLSGTGTVFRYRRSTTAPYDWTREWQLDPSTWISDQVNRHFGSAVGTLGEIDLAGAAGDASDAAGAGSAFYYDYIPSNGRRFSASDAGAGDAFGSALAVTRTALAVGAPGEDGAVLNSDTGAVYVFPTYTAASTPGGTYGTALVIELTCKLCNALNADIYYTLDGSDPVTSGTAILYTGPISIDSTTTLNYTTIDGAGEAEPVRTETYIIDATAPAATITAPADGSVESSVVPLLVGTATDSGGAGIYTVQVQLLDAATQAVMTNASWETATHDALTDTWQLALDTGVLAQPMVSGSDYRVRVRAFDSVGNRSTVAQSQFTYYTGTPAFTTLDLSLSSSSILNGGDVDVSIDLDIPGDTTTDLSGRTVTLDITDPNSAVTTLTCTTDSLGNVTIDNLGTNGALAVCTPQGGISFGLKGTYTLQAGYPGTFDSDPANSAARALLVGSSAGYAVLIQGRLESNGVNDGLLEHSKTANRIYQTLKDRGFQDADIWYFNPDPNQDGSVTDPDNANPATFAPGIDGLPTESAIAAVFTDTATGSLAERASNNPAPVYVIEVDHGDPNTFYNDADIDDGTAPAEVITAQELDGWLDTLEASLATLNGGAAANEPVFAILGMCYSGSFIGPPTDIERISAPGRYVITSAAENEVSYKGTLEAADNIRVGEYFLEEFFLQAGRGIDLADSLEYAIAVTETYTRRDSTSGPQGPYNDTAVQHPLVDTNGDGIGANELLEPTASDPDPDGLALRGHFLGVGPDYVTNSISNPADITSVTPTRFLPDGVNTTFLQLTANYDSEVEPPAWIEVRAPSTSYLTQTGSIQIDPTLDRQFLSSPTVCQAAFSIDAWCTPYSSFATPGMYEVFYFVKDKGDPGAGIEGRVAPAQRSVVYRNKSGNDYASTLEPTAFQLLTPADSDDTATTLTFTWSPSTDADGLSYTLEIATDSAFTAIVHRQEELTGTHAVVDGSASLVDSTTYYWRVYAIDGYGTRTLATHADTGNPWGQFLTNNNQNGIPGIIYTTVRDATSLVTLDGVVVGVSETTSSLDVYENNGMYTMVIQPAISSAGNGLYTVQANLTGYSSNSAAGVNATTNPSISIALDAQVTDSDGDGLTDTLELAIGTDPNLADSDGDGLDDAVEVGFDGNAGAYDPYHPVNNPTGTDLDANNPDTDGDGVDDATEYNNSTGSQPIDPAGYPFLADADLAPLGSPDGLQNAADIVVVQRIALGDLAATNLELAHGDMNMDGVIDTADVLLVTRAVLATP